MNKKNIVQELETIFRDVLDDDNIRVSESTSAADIEEWDSLTHVQLVVAIEKHFRLKFNATEVLNWKNVGEMAVSIDAKLNGESGIKKEEVKEHIAFVKSSLDNMRNEDIPSYRRNFIDQFETLQHGKNCFVGEGATLTNVRMGDQVWINKFATMFSSYTPISIGSNCYIGPYTWIEGHAGLEIGNSVHIGGPGTSIYTHSGIKMALNGQHLGNPGYKPKLERSYDFRVPVRIGNNVWIGPNCSISPAVIIQDYVVVMPNTLVRSGIIESFSLVHGDGLVEKNSEFVKAFIEENVNPLH